MKQYLINQATILPLIPVAMLAGIYAGLLILKIGGFYG